MGEAAEVDWGEVITAAGQSPLTLVALVVVSFLILAILFFRNASTRAKMVIFFSLLASAAGLVVLVLGTKAELQATSDTADAAKKGADTVAQESQGLAAWQAQNPNAPPPKKKDDF